MDRWRDWLHCHEGEDRERAREGATGPQAPGGAAASPACLGVLKTGQERAWGIQASLMGVRPATETDSAEAHTGNGAAQSSSKGKWSAPVGWSCRSIYRSELEAAEPGASQPVGEPPVHHRGWPNTTPPFLTKNACLNSHGQATRQARARVSMHHHGHGGACEEGLDVSRPCPCANLSRCFFSLPWSTIPPTTTRQDDHL